MNLGRLPLFEIGYAAVEGKIEPSNRKLNLITRLFGLESDLFSYPYMNVRDFLSKRTPLGGTGFVIKRDILIRQASSVSNIYLSFHINDAIMKINLINKIC